MFLLICHNINIFTKPKSKKMEFEEIDFSIYLKVIASTFDKIKSWTEKAKQIPNFSTQLLHEAEFNSSQLENLKDEASTCFNSYLHKMYSLHETKDTLTDQWIKLNKDNNFEFHYIDDIRMSYRKVQFDIDNLKLRTTEISSYIQKLLQSMRSFIQMYQNAIENHSEFDSFPSWNYGIGAPTDFLFFH